ncbi:hypothetical protein K1X76_09500 [bacterium]|nr:hypothetical protein [bacterium]
MKKIVTLTLLFLMVGSVSPVWARHSRYNSDAEWQEKHDERVKERTDKMAKELGLTNEQKIKFEKILKEHGDQFRALREETNKKKQALKADLDKDLKELLNAEQEKKYEEIKQEHTGFTKKGGAHHKKAK